MAKAAPDTNAILHLTCCTREVRTGSSPHRTRFLRLITPAATATSLMMRDTSADARLLVTERIAARVHGPGAVSPSMRSRLMWGPPG